MAIFPGNEGQFRTVDLTVRGHYEVHGENDDMGEPASVPGQFPTRFSFRRPVSAAAEGEAGKLQLQLQGPLQEHPWLRLSKGDQIL